MSRLWAEGRALDVRAEAGAPVALRWKEVWHPVLHIALRWRVDLRWWRARIHREYFKLLAGQMALVIYHDLLDDVWAIQRIYD